MKRLELRVEGEAFKGKRFAVPAGGLRLGRSSSNDIPVRDEELSRNHCLFEQAGESGIRVTDLASANGTFVNEQRLGAESVDLKAGDVIRVGETFITVVDEVSARVQFDLGLGKTQAWQKPGAAAKQPAAARRPPILNVLWAVVVVALGASIWLLLNTPSRPAAQTVEIVEENPTLVAMRYERVNADSRAIFRYCLTFTPDGTLRVVIDDTADDRHNDKNKTLTDETKARLTKLLSDEAFNDLREEEYAGSEEELNSRSLTYYTTSTRKSVKAVNTAEPPAAFRRVCDDLETFANNELGILGWQYTREQLLEMARTASETGRMKWEDRDVEYGNLYASIRKFREAISYLETLNPKPDEFEEYRKALDRAKAELDARCKTQSFVVEQARSTEDWEKYRRELIVLRDMISNREDERYLKAERELHDVESRLDKRQKGGRR